MWTVTASANTIALECVARWCVSVYLVVRTMVECPDLKTDRQVDIRIM